jgi:hypothetical protein
MQIIKGKAFSWANGLPGWITLHAHEHQTLFLMMNSFKSKKVEELEVKITQGSRKRKYYRIYVENLGLAYEALSVARLSSIARLSKAK